MVIKYSTYFSFRGRKPSARRCRFDCIPWTEARSARPWSGPETFSCQGIRCTEPWQPRRGKPERNKILTMLFQQLKNDFIWFCSGFQACSIGNRRVIRRTVKWKLEKNQLLPEFSHFQNCGLRTMFTKMRSDPVDCRLWCIISFQHQIK